MSDWARTSAVERSLKGERVTSRVARHLLMRERAHVLATSQQVRRSPAPPVCVDSSPECGHVSRPNSSAGPQTTDLSLQYRLDVAESAQLSGVFLHALDATENPNKFDSDDEDDSAAYRPYQWRERADTRLACLNLLARPMQVRTDALSALLVLFVATCHARSAPQTHQSDSS